MGLGSTYGLIPCTALWIFASRENWVVEGGANSRCADSCGGLLETGREEKGPRRKEFSLSQRRSPR